MASALEAVAAGLGAAILVHTIAQRRRAFVPAMVVLGAFAIGSAAYAQFLPADAAAIDKVADMDSGLVHIVQKAGGADAVLDCGSPTTPWYTVTALAWDLGVPPDNVNDRSVGGRPVVFSSDRERWRLSEPRRCRLVAAEPA
jgi:hypothetical protein